MKKRRWIIGISAVLLLFFGIRGVGRYRWSQLPDAEKAGIITEKISRRLDLTDEQKGKVYALTLEKVGRVADARQSGQHPRGEWKKMHEDWKNGVREILTAEQQKHFWH